MLTKIVISLLLLIALTSSIRIGSYNHKYDHNHHNHHPYFGTFYHKAQNAHLDRNRTLEYDHDLAHREPTHDCLGWPLCVNP